LILSMKNKLSLKWGFIQLRKVKFLPLGPNLRKTNFSSVWSKTLGWFGEIFQRQKNLPELLQINKVPELRRFQLTSKRCFHHNKNPSIHQFLSKRFFKSDSKRNSDWKLNWLMKKQVKILWIEEIFKKSIPFGKGIWERSRSKD
jgi:hypothetical protein